MPMNSTTILKTSILISLFILATYFIYSQSLADSSQHPACCATEDGFCRDIGVPPGQTGCGIEHQGYTLISDSKFCNQFDECYNGYCTLRTHQQPVQKEYYECIATCKEAGECKCTGDLKTCTGQFSWVKGPMV